MTGRIGMTGRIAILLGAMAGWGVLPRIAAQGVDEQSLEYQVKAAFLLNFTKFIEWTPSAFVDSGSPLAICLLGDDPFGGALNQMLEGETVNARKLVVQRLRRAPAPKQCQVLFIGKSEKDTREIVTGLGPGVLSVGEGDNFLQEGGMIAFVIDNRRVRFDINQTAVDAAALKMSSKLLNVARTVRK